MDTAYSDLKHLLPATLVVTISLGLSTSAFSQQFPEPVPSTPDPAGSAVPDETTDGVVPADRSTNLDQTSKTAPAILLTDAERQKWQEIGKLHWELVQSQVKEIGTQSSTSLQTLQERRYRELWERLGEIEKQLIATRAVLETPEAQSGGDLETRNFIRSSDPAVENPAVPRRDLDLTADPLTSTNQGVSSSAVERDKQTARSILQEDRSPAADPATANNPPKSLAPSADANRTAQRPIRDRNVTTTAGTATQSDSLWQQFIEVRREILIMELALADEQSADDEIPSQESTRAVESSSAAPRADQP